jgi:anti-sigma B factor antagonist
MTEDDEVVVVAIRGGIDISNSLHISGAVMTEAVRSARGVVLDLTAVDYLDSSGVHLLVQLRHRLTTRRQALHLAVRPDSVVREVLDVTDLPSIVPVHADVPGAIAGLMAPRSED